MRHISAPFLVFWAIVLPACGPDLPSIDMASQPGDGGDDKSVVPVDAHLGAAPPDAAPTRAEAAVLEARADAARPDAPDAPAEARPDSGPTEARADAGPLEARPDTAPPDARADAAPPEAHPDGRPEARSDGEMTESGLDAVADMLPDVSLETPLAREPRAWEIRIVEVLVDPDGNDLGHEWFEILNVAREPLSLADLHVSDSATDVAVGAGVLAAGARLVLGQSLDRAHNGDAPVDVSYGTKLALNNDSDRIAVCLGACAGGGVLDAFEWTTAWGAAFVGHAIIVEPDTGDTCAASAPYGEGGNFGTPGAPNPSCN